ncbi:hypothetical protein ACZ87_04084, partial [Candidatus Erwinia dacicola]
MGHLWCWEGENITFRSDGQYQCATPPTGKSSPHSKELYDADVSPALVSKV